MPEGYPKAFPFRGMHFFASIEKAPAETRRRGVTRECGLLCSKRQGEVMRWSVGLEFDLALGKEQGQHLKWKVFQHQNNAGCDT